MSPGDANYSDARTLFQIRVDYLYNILRALTFSFISWSFSKYKREFRVPPELANLLVEFIKDEKSQVCFALYVRTLPNGTALVEQINDLIKEVLVIENSSQSCHRSLPLAPPDLEKVFIIYKQTKSFAQLVKEVTIAHEVDAIGMRKF